MIGRLLALCISAVVLALLLAKRAEADMPWPPPSIIVESTFQGHNAEWWAHRTTFWKRRELRARKILRPTVDHAIKLAAVTFGVSVVQLHHVASCESGHDPLAVNGIYRGVFQEGPMFERGPFASFGVWDPVANALTAAHTVAREGWSQWSCKP